MKNGSIKFSVLMSVYRKENPLFLELSLMSIIEKQTLVPNEVVLIKDGPLNDELDEVINKYKGKYKSIFKVYSLEKNSGLGIALNYGLKKCTNEIIMRMDTDDIAVPNRFELQINYMKEHPDVSIVGGYIKEFQNDINEQMRLKVMPITYDEIIKYSKSRNPLNHMTVCFKRQDILSVGNYQSLQFLEDYFLWIKLLINGKKIANIPEVLVYARIGNGFSERRGSKKIISSWRYLQRYMFENKYINLFQKIKNNIYIYIFTSIPNNVRDKIYSKFLRNKITHK